MATAVNTQREAILPKTTEWLFSCARKKKCQCIEPVKLSSILVMNSIQHKAIILMGAENGALDDFWWFRLVHNDSVWQILVLYWQNSTKCFPNAKQAANASQRISKQRAGACCNLFLIITDDINGWPGYLLRFPLGIRREARQSKLQCSCWAAGAAGRGLGQSGIQGSVFVMRVTWSIGLIWRDICGVGSLKSSFNLTLGTCSHGLGSVEAAQMKM